MSADLTGVRDLARDLADHRAQACLLAVRLRIELRMAREAGATLGQLSTATNLSRQRIAQLTR